MVLLTIETLRQRVEVLCLITGKPCLKIGECRSLASTFSHPHMTPHIDPSALSRITTNRNFWFQMSQHYASPRKLFKQLVTPLPHSAAPSKPGEGDSFQERAGLSFSTFVVEDSLAQPTCYLTVSVTRYFLGQ